MIKELRNERRRRLKLAVIIEEVNEKLKKARNRVFELEAELEGHKQKAKQKFLEHEDRLTDGGL